MLGDLRAPAPALGAAQQPVWPDPTAAAAARAVLAHRPPLVPEAEVRELSAALAGIAEQGGLILQGGDCAELFTDSAPHVVQRKLDQLHATADRLRAGLGRPVLPLGRLAGQYAKPRSSPWQRLPDDALVPSYLGDAVNGVTATPAARAPDPSRLLAAYDHADRTLAQVRRSWPDRPPAHRVRASHELLLLDYEEPQIRFGEHGHFVGSTHFGWIGERTRDPSGPHLELAASIQNPIGVKLGPTTRAEDIVRLARRLNPESIPGRLVFIVRMGAAVVGERLADLLRTVDRAAAPALWMCDPMHGNTIRNGSGQKVRAVTSICRELEAFCRAVHAVGLPVGGVHLEMTPDHVTECVAADPPAENEHHLPDYRSPCDPRLNPEQVAEVTDRLLTLL